MDVGIFIYLFYDTKFTMEWECGLKHARSLNMYLIKMLSKIFSTPIY